MMLIATPDTTWSTPNETVATACKSAPTAPKIIAANNPIQGPCWEPINPPAHAPKIIIPSRPIFTTPARSENNPPSPAKMIGTESNNAADTVPTLVNSVAPVINRIIEMSNKRYVAFKSNLVALFFMLRPPLQALCFVRSISIYAPLHRQ